MRNVPKLRFKEFTDEWEEKRLGNYLIEFKEKIPYTTNLPKLTSSRKGLLFQKDYYDNREVKTETEYGLLPRGYFTYRHMSDDLIFKFNINDLVDNGAISKEYPVFTTKNFDSRFLYYLLNYGDDFKKFAIEQKQGGTRTRLYFKKLITFSPKAPILNEQNKIGKFIFNIDKRISITEEKLNLFNEYKKGIMHKLFNQELRFKDANGNDYPEWEEKKLGELLEEYNEKTTTNNQYPILSSTAGGIYLQSEYFNKQTASENNIGYKIIPKGYFTYRSMSDTGNFTFNIQERINFGIVSPAYPVFSTKLEKCNKKFLFFYLNNSDFIKEQILVLKEGGTRYALSYSKFIKLFSKLPCLEEQQKIADFLSSIDTKIEKISDELENLKEFKKGLLQQMFV